MKRKEFIASGIMGAASLALMGMKVAVKDIQSARDLQEYLRSLHPVGEPSVDRIIIGDPETRIRKVVTAWMPYWKTLRETHTRGANVLVVHEPTFYNHWDLDGEGDHRKAAGDYEQIIAEKKAWIEEKGLVIIRSHDVPDILKGMGMPFALGQVLGFGQEDLLRNRDYYNVYRTPEDSAGNLAKVIAGKLEKLNQPGVAFYGDPDRRIRSVGVGTGCICDPREFADMGADMHLAIDDTVRTWIQTTFAEDTGQPLMVINHGTAEDFGMQLLAEKLREESSFEVEHIRQGCGYRWITA